MIYRLTARQVREDADWLSDADGDGTEICILFIVVIYPPPPRLVTGVANNSFDVIMFVASPSGNARKRAPTRKLPRLESPCADGAHNTAQLRDGEHSEFIY